MANLCALLGIKVGLYRAFSFWWLHRKRIATFTELFQQNEIVRPTKTKSWQKQCSSKTNTSNICDIQRRNQLTANNPQKTERHGAQNEDKFMQSNDKYVECYTYRAGKG